MLLGWIVVVDNINNAVKIAGKFHHSIRMVTIEGELLVPGGAISCSAFKNKKQFAEAPAQDGGTGEKDQAVCHGDRSPFGRY